MEEGKTVGGFSSCSEAWLVVSNDERAVGPRWEAIISAIVLSYRVRDACSVDEMEVSLVLSPHIDAHMRLESRTDWIGCDTNDG